MTERSTITVQPREIKGKKNRQLRRTGVIPGVVYGAQIENLLVELDQKTFQKLYRQIGEAELIDLLVEKESASRPVLIVDVQQNPLTRLPLHVDFLQVDLSKKVDVDVAVEIVGESLAVKEHKGILLTLVDELPIRALPTEIPHAIEVDISNLREVDDQITVAELSVPIGVEVMVDDPTELVVKIERESKTLEEEAAEEAAEETETQAEPIDEAAAGESETEGKEKTSD